MSKARILLALSLWIMILPYLGFPYSWKDTLTTLTGLVFVFFSYLFYRDNKATEKKDKTFDSFKENSDFSTSENIDNQKL